MSLNYSYARKLIDPCDLVLFRGIDVISKLICKIEKLETNDGDYSHVGVIVTKELLPNIEELEPDRLYVLESTVTIHKFTDGVPDVRTKKTREGVQIRDLELVVKMYTKNGGKVAWGKLIKNPYLYNKNDTVKKITNLVNKYGYRSYDFSIFDELSAAFTFLRPIRLKFEGFEYEGMKILSTLKITERKDMEDIKERVIFCSDLVCLVYQHIGLIPKSTDSKDVMPIDFIVERPKEPKGTKGTKVCNIVTELLPA
jgi:hypothetical protein